MSDEQGQAIDVRSTDNNEPTTDLAVAATQVVEHRTESPQAAQWRLRNTIAGRLVNTDFVPVAYKGKPDQVLACLAYGEEISLGPMQALQSIDVIQGKPTLKPEAMRALILGAGHSLVRVESTDESCTFRGKRRDNGDEETVTFTIEQARRLGLTDKDNWRKQPKAMLTARCTGEIARSLFPDVIRGASYTPEEMGDDTPHEDEPVHIPMDEPRKPPFAIVTDGSRNDAGRVVRTAPADPCPSCSHERGDHGGLGSAAGCRHCACDLTFDDPVVAPAPASTPADSGDESPVPAALGVPTPDAAGPGPSDEEIPAALKPPEGKFRRMQAMFKEQGCGDDERHAVVEFITGSRTTSSREISNAETETVLNLLSKIKTGQLAVREHDGAMRVVALTTRGTEFLRTVEKALTPGAFQAGNRAAPNVEPVPS